MKLIDKLDPCYHIRGYHHGLRLYLSFNKNQFLSS